MSSSTSDSSLSSRIIDSVADCISHLQQRQVFTKERFQSLRIVCFRLLGLIVILYSLLRMFISIILSIKFAACSLYSMLLIVCLLPFKTIQLFLPETASYKVLFPLFCFGLLLSSIISKLSQKKVEVQLERRFKSIKHHSFFLTFTILLLLQSALITLPVALAIKAQKNSLLSPTVIKESVKHLRDKSIAQPSTKFHSVSQQGSKFESNVEDEHSYLNDRIKHDKNIDESTTHLQDKIDLDEENISLLKQRIKSRHDSSQHASSIQYKKSIDDRMEQSETIRSNKVKGPRSVALRQKLKKWFSETLHIWYQTKVDLLQLFIAREKHTYSLSRPSNASSIYVAYTDLVCYDYTQSISSSSLKHKHIQFLNNYRHRSPFPVYLSILKSNGPQCYQDYSNSFCAINSKSLFTILKQVSDSLIRFAIIVSIPIIIYICIYKNLKRKQSPTKNPLSPNIDLQIISNVNVTTASINIDNNKHVLDKKLDADLRTWLQHEKNDGYRNISEACRIALNNTFSKNEERLNIETLQFVNAKFYDISQTSTEKIIINAVLDIVHLIFNIINTTKYQHYSVEIPKLTGELEIFLTTNVNQYSIEVKFKQIQIDSAQIIDPKSVLSSDEKKLIIQLLKQTINQTVVQCFCHLLENQETINNEFRTQISTQSPVLQPINGTQQGETPVLVSTNNNSRSEVSHHDKRIVRIRIVKAVKLYDVEQPFCIIELNQPKQTFQTSIAKNGLNPFWDECFLFESNEKSNKIRLTIMDRKKPNKRHNIIKDTVYADVSIPYSYVTSTIYKQDVQITPQHPDSMIRIEVSTLSEEEALAGNRGYDAESLNSSHNWSTTGREINKPQHLAQQSPSNEIVPLPYNGSVTTKDNGYASNLYHISSVLPQPTTIHSLSDAFSTLSHQTSPVHDNELTQSRRSRPLMNSFRRFSFLRRKKVPKIDHANEYANMSPSEISTRANTIPHSFSAEPFSPINPPIVRTNDSFSRSFRKMFRSGRKKNRLDTSHVTQDSVDLPSTSTPTPVKRSFFSRFKLRKKQSTTFSTNSLTSDDCTRSESVRNTPVRANDGRPVTIK